MHKNEEQQPSVKPKAATGQEDVAQPNSPAQIQSQARSDGNQLVHAAPENSMAYPKTELTVEAAKCSTTSPAVRVNEDSFKNFLHANQIDQSASENLPEQYLNKAKQQDGSLCKYNNRASWPLRLASSGNNVWGYHHLNKSSKAYKQFQPQFAYNLNEQGEKINPLYKM